MILGFRLLCAVLLISLPISESVRQAFRRDPGHPQWHHSAFRDVSDGVRSDVKRMLHTRAEVPFNVPLEVNIVLIGFSGDGGYRYSIDPHKLEDFLRLSFPSHRPSCLETGEPLDIEHHIVYNVFSVRLFLVFVNCYVCNARMISLRLHNFKGI